MIARKSFLIISSQFLARFLGWIGLVILARSWPGKSAPAALGSIAFTMSALALFNIIADLGFSRAHVKRISEGKDIGTCIGTYAAIKLILTSIMITVVFVTIYIWKVVYHKDFFDATKDSIVYIMLFYYVFLNLGQIAFYTFEGRREIAKRQIMQLFESIKTPFMILVAFAGATGILVEGELVSFPSKIQWPEFLIPLQRFISEHALGALTMTYMFSMIAMFLVGLWFLRKYPIKKPSFEMFKSYFNFALPTILFSVVGVISINIDKIMIGYFYSNIEVGYYFGAQMIVSMVMILYLAVGTVLFPTISEFHSGNQIDKIKNTTRLAERYISMVMVPPLVVIMVLVTPVISTIVSSAFLPASYALITLCFYTFIFSISRPYSALITGMNRPGITTRIGLGMCLVNIPLNYLFIPENGLLSPFGIYGITGAAIATTLSVFVGFFGLRLYAKKLSGIKILQTHTPRHLIAGILMAAVIYFLAYRSSFFTPTDLHWYHLLILAGVGLLVYMGILVLLREFKKKDFVFFLDIIHPHKMLKYVSSELKEKPEK